MNSAVEAQLAELGIEGYLKQHQYKSLLRFLTCGSVDDGKSTLIGRLLHDSKQIYEDQLAAVHSDSQRVGTTGPIWRCLSMVCRLSVNKASQSMLLTVTSRRKA